MRKRVREVRLDLVVDPAAPGPASLGSWATRTWMLDAATQAEVGTFLVSCLLIDPAQSLYSCPANTITLTGRGQTVFTETLLFVSGASPEAWKKWASTWKYGDFVITIIQ